MIALTVRENASDIGLCGPVTSAVSRCVVTLNACASHFGIMHAPIKMFCVRHDPTPKNTLAKFHFNQTTPHPLK